MLRVPHFVVMTMLAGVAQLAAAQGYPNQPVRLIAPGRRGFQWVKWVDRIEMLPSLADVARSVV